MIYAENVLICIAVPLVISLLFTKRSTRRFIVSFMTGMIVCLLSAYISGYLAVSTSYSTEEASIFLSPIVEEIMKFLPVLFCFFVFEPSPEDLKPTAVGVGAGQVPSVGNAFHGGSGGQLCGRFVLEVAVHQELAG